MACSCESKLEAVNNKASEIINQDKIKYLKRFVSLDKEITRKLDEVYFWRSKLGKVTAVYTSEPKGGGSIYSKEESIIAKIVDLEQEVNDCIDRLVDIRREIGMLIDAVEDDRERLLLQYRYIDGKTFEEIAVVMHYTWRWVHKLHSQALNSINLK
jgi:DNA-directed RNA polymerase specialized sigma subunit